MKTVVIGAFLGAALVGGRTVANSNPYMIIAERNAFKLVAPPPPPEPVVTNAPPPPPANIALTGMSFLGGVRKVFVEITDPQSKKVSRPAPLLEGDIDGPLEIIQIDTAAGTVRIRNGGIEGTLSFEKNGLKPAAVAAAQPAATGVAPVNIPNPHGTAATGAAAAAAAAANLQRDSRMIVGGAQIGGGVDAAGRAIPARPLRTTGEQPQSLEQIIARQQISRELNAQQAASGQRVAPFPGASARPAVPTPGGNTPGAYPLPQNPGGPAPAWPPRGPQAGQ